LTSVNTTLDYLSETENGLREKSLTMAGRGGLRTDRSGNRIQKGVKSHKITFADNVQEDNAKPRLTDVYLVESYKKYN
jgi:hypothetical protein